MQARPIGKRLQQRYRTVGPATGFAWFFNGAWSGPTGGTSLACPIYSALQIEINQKENSRNGFVNTRIYNVFKTSGYADFHDVTSGSNGAFFRAQRLRQRDGNRIGERLELGGSRVID